MNLNDRIDFHDTLQFQNLPTALEQAAQHLPFENTAVLKGDADNIQPTYLYDKIITKGEGGLCYDLNPAFYLYLEQAGFDVELLTGCVYNSDTRDYGTRTHVTILLNHDRQPYIIDTGFGGNLPLVPVPFDRTVTSRNGAFKVVQQDGRFFLYMKLNDEDWRPGYEFFPKEPVTEWETITDIKLQILHDKSSKFNKGLIATRFTPSGRMTLSNNQLKTMQPDSQQLVSPQERDALLQQYFRN